MIFFDELLLLQPFVGLKRSRLLDQNFNLRVHRFLLRNKTPTLILPQITKFKLKILGCVFYLSIQFLNLSLGLTFHFKREALSHAPLRALAQKIHNQLINKICSRDLPNPPIQLHPNFAIQLTITRPGLAHQSYQIQIIVYPQNQLVGLIHHSSVQLNQSLVPSVSNFIKNFPFPSQPRLAPITASSCLIQHSVSNPIFTIFPKKKIKKKYYWVVGGE
jgi:hypothetical protein